MKLHEALDLPAGEELLGFYLEVEAGAGRVYLRRAKDDKLVVRVTMEDMTFYDPDEIDIYNIEGPPTDEQEAAVTLVLDSAWGYEGFSKEALASMLVAMEMLSTMTGEGEA